jgi:Flp pilus assembly protein CpaB
MKIDAGISSFLCPGQRVDVFVVRTNNENQPTCKIVFENVLLLACKATGEDAPVTATVAVTPEQAERLADAMKSGAIHLAIRPPEKEKAADKSGRLLELPAATRAVGFLDQSWGSGAFILPG